MESKHLQFSQDMGYKGLTKKFFIRSKWDGSILGEVKWNPQWRQYCFYPNISFETQWSIDCLQDLTNFIQVLKDERKNNKVIS
jgi:hypothetical protein